MRPPSNAKVTVPALRARKSGGRRITMLTAYDSQMAAILDETGVDVLLVGDSVGMVALGYENTLPVTVEEMLHHTRAVARGRRRALLVADLPYLSYHLSVDETIRNAGRFLKEAGAEAVKVEGGRDRRDVIAALVRAEIPVMGHVGLTPQSIHRFGGYQVQGRDRSQVGRLLDDAAAVEEAGAFALVLEGIPGEVAGAITRRVGIPTIGIGAGPHCDGQVLVINDLLGLDAGPAPRFVRRYADLRGEIRRAVERFFADVEGGGFPSEAETYPLPESVALDLAREFGAERGSR